MVTLVADTRSGERVPVECGTLTGQKMFDSVSGLDCYITIVYCNQEDHTVINIFLSYAPFVTNICSKTSNNVW